MTWFIILLQIVQVLLISLAIFVVYVTVKGFLTVPWVRTGQKVSREMLEFASLKKGERMVDFGSGDGSIVLSAAQDFDATGHGIELFWFLVVISRVRAFFQGVGERATFSHGNIFSSELPAADVIVTYLFPRVNQKLLPLLLSRYPSGTRVVSRTFEFKGLKHKQTKNILGEIIHLYEIP